jgi:hypothetical protein
MRKFIYSFYYLPDGAITKVVGTFSLIAEDIAQANKMFDYLYGGKFQDRCSAPYYKPLEVFCITETSNLL